MVEAVRRAGKRRPALPISQIRPDDLGPCPRVPLAEFITDHAVEIESAQTVEVIGPIEPDAPVAGQIDALSGDAGILRMPPIGELR